MFSVPSMPGENLCKVSQNSRVFTDLLLNSPKRSPRFSPGYDGMENMFYFLTENGIKQLKNLSFVESTMFFDVSKYTYTIYRA